MFDEREQARLLRLLWAEAGYTPTVGYWPIIDLEGNERTVSRGQQEIHDCPARLIMVTGGVRAGKSQFLAMELLRYIFKQDGLIWIVGPDYEQAKGEFDYMFRLDVIEHLDRIEAKCKQWGVAMNKITLIMRNPDRPEILIS